MDVRPRHGRTRLHWRAIRRWLSAGLRWGFILIGAVTAASVLFGHLYAVNSTVYDPSLFAIGVGGLFAMLCGAMLMVMARNGRQRAELRRAAERCEELADRVWELKESEERAASLLESQGDVILRRDAEGRITYANDAFCRLMGAPRETLIGSTATPEVLTQGGISLLEDGTRLHDQRIASGDGPRWLAWRDVPVLSKDGDRAEILSVAHDVTARAESERALAEARDAAESASRAKSRFLAMVSHEIRTPLNGILGMSELLLDTPLTPEQKAYAEAARTSGLTLLSLIEEVLDFSKIEAGRLELEMAPFDPLRLVEEAVELLGPRAQAKGLEIAADVDERIAQTAMGDAARLRQVILNLAGNAIKFTERGGVGVTVSPGAAPGEIVLTVRDTGIGIAPGERERIFNEFEQADGGTARRQGGTGLGLAITRRIVDRMGGRIELDSRPGEGTEFRVIVPMHRARDDGTPTFEPPDLGGRTILVVTDGPMSGMLLAQRLRRWGGEVQCAGPDEAAARLAERHWDTVIADFAIGATALGTLIAAADERAGRRVVLIAPGERHGLAALMAAGFDGYLVKPVRAASLRSRLLPGEADEGDDKTAQAGHDPAREPQPQAGLQVLVAEDNEINALLVRSMLAKLGHRPVMASDGAAAIDAWRCALEGGTPFDAILMDVQMPEVDGLEATRRLRAAEVNCSAPRTPVVALTANAYAEDREACIAAGMDAFLVKPLDRDRLAAALSEIAARRSAAA